MDSVLRDAAALLRRRAAEAATAEGERWTVDQDDDGGLVVSAYTPDDVDPDGTIGGVVVAWYAYPESVGRHAPARAMAAASHTAGLDPRTAVHLAAWLDATAYLEDRAAEVGGPEAAAPAVRPAHDFARAYLRAG